MRSNAPDGASTAGPLTADRVHDALGSRTRRRVLAALTDRKEPVDAAALAADLDLHVTTVRFHLDPLERAGLIARAPAVERRRGRPRMLYVATRAAERADRAREGLIAALAGALSQHEPALARRRAREAGKVWARELLDTHPATGSGTDDLFALLERQGFVPQVEPGGLRLLGCPFREAAREHPGIVCAVHQGVVDEAFGGRVASATADAPTATADSLFDQEPGGAARATLLPFVAPALCRIRYDGPGTDAQD